jgi:magnesium transporter
MSLGICFRAITRKGIRDKIVITIQYLDGDKQLHLGGTDLIERWNNEPEGRLWIDFEQSPCSEEGQILEAFGVHELAIKDAHRDRHPPKIEAFEGHHFILFRGISEIDQNLTLEHLQIAIFVGERFVITRHDRPSKSISFWREHSRTPELLSEPMTLVLSILHYSSGLYLQQLLNFEERLSDLEDIVQQRVDDEAIRELTIYKTRLRKLRRLFDYHQRMLSVLRPLMELDNELFTSDCRHQFQDFYERCERLHSLASMYYEICGDLIEGTLSLASHQLNQTMQVLTVITAVFVPLSFLAGIYGMNFEYIPELKFQWGYFGLIGFMLVIASSLLWVFRRKHWI